MDSGFAMEQQKGREAQTEQLELQGKRSESIIFDRKHRKLPPKKKLIAKQQQSA